VSRPIFVRLEALMRSESASIDPRRHPDEVFELYSIPAFDRGTPDIVAGGDIGSAKQIVAVNDVLLSRIVPHIRRTWPVTRANGKVQIASSEWIVFPVMRSWA
jgi:type I restriction enzyme S subunit